MRLRLALVGSLALLAACASSRGRTWTASDLRNAAPTWAGCWAFTPFGEGSLRDPLSDGRIAFPIAEGVELSLREARDVWANLERVRHPVAFKADVLSHPFLASYWIPQADGAGFLLKWRDESQASRHVVLRVRTTSEGFESHASLPGAHIGLVLEPPIEAKRCDVMEE